MYAPTRSTSRVVAPVRSTTSSALPITYVLRESSQSRPEEAREPVPAAPPARLVVGHEAPVVDRMPEREDEDKGAQQHPLRTRRHRGQQRRRAAGLAVSLAVLYAARLRQ